MTDDLKHLERLITDMKESLEREMREGFGRIDKANDAIIVTTALALGHEARIKEHADWLRANELAAARHREWLKQHEAAMHALDEKLDRIADLILKGRGGNGHS